MTNPVRFALVGAGGIAQSHAQAFENAEHAQLAAVADSRPEAARTLAQRFGCPSYESYQALADGTPCDAVIICTPPNTHPEISTHFLRRGVHVLCEKPFAIDAA